MAEAIAATAGVAAPIIQAKAALWDRLKQTIASSNDMVEISGALDDAMKMLVAKRDDHEDMIHKTTMMPSNTYFNWNHSVNVVVKEMDELLARYTKEKNRSSWFSIKSRANFIRKMKKTASRAVALMEEHTHLVDKKPACVVETIPSKITNIPTLQHSLEQTSSSSKGQFYLQFTIAQIRFATQDFNKSLLIGRGGYGDYYKGTIEDGTIVAIQCLNSTSAVDPRKFQAIVDSLPVLQHHNIVSLIGYCNDGQENILVYEYMSNGSLGDHLHKHRTPLSWSQRLSICIDVAHALEYLHNGTSGQVVIHNRVTSSAILLDSQWAAKIKGYDHPTTHRVSSNTNSDLYSFGALLDEVLCKRGGNMLVGLDVRVKNIVENCMTGHPVEGYTMTHAVSDLRHILAIEEGKLISVGQMSITTSDSYKRLHEYFFCCEQNSGGSYFAKDIKHFCSKSLNYMEPFYTLEVYLRRADVLMRMKDFLHLIWSYSMKKEANVNFGSLIDKFSFLNAYTRELMHSKDRGKDRDWRGAMISKLHHDIEEDLVDAAFDMVAYVPYGLVLRGSMSVGFVNLETEANSEHVPFASFWSGIAEVHAIAVASATYRAVSCIKDLKVKKLGISGVGADQVAERLKGMPELRSAFDVVLCVCVKDNSVRGLLRDIKEEMRLWKIRSSETGKKMDDSDQSFQIKDCLLFVDFSDNFIDLQEPESTFSKWFKTLKTVMTSGIQNADHPVDLEIRVEDHYLPWILFSMNADLESMVKYSSIQRMAIDIIEKCHGHLLAIILLARALRGVTDVSVWELALQGLASEEEPSSSQFDVRSDVIVKVLRFILTHMQSISQRCIIKSASSYVGAEFDKKSLINSWIIDGLVTGEQEGVHVFEDLIRSFLLEQVGENSFRMRDETRVTLLAYIVPRAYGLYLKGDGSESNKMPNVEEWDAREIHLSNNIISDLPDNPNSPVLVSLFLHFNQDLMDIPVTFFDNMPSLQVLDLSGTSIRCLPSTISKLTILRQLLIRDCSLLMELPPEIGALKNLKVFDSEGTQLLCLPEQIGWLTKLECLKFSLYNFADRERNRRTQIIHAEALSKLNRLKELRICVNSYCKGWEDELKRIIEILPKLWQLESLTLYIPTTVLLEVFINTKNWQCVSIYHHLTNFCFTVGHLQQRMISRVSDDLHKTFVKLPKCLIYTNGEKDINVISKALFLVNALFLDRHWTVQSLSDFGWLEISELKFCLLSECNEMLEIFNGSNIRYKNVRYMLRSLEHLSVHYMKSLICIWRGPILNECLSNLKTLAMHSCPELKTIFTQGLLDSLASLEYLVVEDCTRIKSLVSLESDHSKSTPSLPSLKKISLVHLPELVSISCGISIAPRLESLVVYDCPNLEKLSYMEASDDLREIRGENEWWDALKWCEPEWTNGQPDYLARVFIPLGTHDDIMDELADAVNLIPHLGIEESTKEARTVQVNNRPGPTHDKGKGKI